MKTVKPFAGVLAPVLTPFRQDMVPDPERFVTHCRWLLEQGITGLAVFGTTSEANSLSATKNLLEGQVLQSNMPAYRAKISVSTCDDCVLKIDLFNG